MDTERQKTICYYISDYGFGHAARSIAIIRALCKEKNNIRVIVCTSFPYAFMDESLKLLINKGQVSMRLAINDIGYVLQPGSLNPDRDRLKAKYSAFVERMSDFAREEVHFLKNVQASLVIGDIPPVPFKAARLLSIPSIGISNFTWHTAYHDLLSEEELQPLFNCYVQMDYFFALAGSGERPWGQKGNASFGFFSRFPDSEEIRRIRIRISPECDKKIIFFGLGMSIEAMDLAAYPLWKSENCVFVVSNQTDIKRENIYKIPNSYAESQNYIAASDVVISKPGWGTVAEAVSFNKPLILVSRNHMREDQNTIDYLKARNRCEMVEWEKLKDYQLKHELLNHLERQKKIKTSSPGLNLNGLVKEISAILDCKQMSNLNFE